MPQNAAYFSLDPMTHVRFASQLVSQMLFMKTKSFISRFLWLTACCAFSSTLTAASGPDASDAAEIKATIAKREKQALETFKTHDKKLYAELCLPDFYEITSEGTINTLQDELKELDDYVLGDYRMEDVVVTVLSRTTALIRYKIHAQYTFKGKPLPVESILATAVWVKEGNEWKAATYQEVKVQEHP